MEHLEASLTWLHVSDIHFGSPDEVLWRDAALRALLETVEVEGSKGWRPDFIFFTGDVTFSGQLCDYNVARDFFDQLLDKTGLKLLKNERLFIIPGNHDADRKEAREIFLPSYVQKHDGLINHDDWIQELRSISNSEDYEAASDRFFRDKPTLMSFLKKFQGFQHFLEDYLGRTINEGQPYLVNRVENARGFRVGVIGFNTAWLAGEKEKDYRQLLGQLPLELALKRLNEMGEVDLAFAMLHHPWEDLLEHDSTRIKDRLRADFDFVLCGHRDDPQLADREPGGDKQVPFLRVGPAYGGDRFPNRFYLARFYIERNKKWLSFNPFKYSKGNSSWLPDVEVLAKLKELYKAETLELGTASPIFAKLPSRWIHLQSPLLPVTAEELKRHEQKAKDDLKELERRKTSFGIESREYEEFCNEKSLIGDLPEWRHLYMGVYGAFPRPKKETELLRVLDKNIGSLEARANGLLFHVISGESGSGKSTLAKLIIRQLCDKTALRKNDLDEFPYLLKVLSRLRIFEINKTGDWDSLEDVLRDNGEYSSNTEEPIFLLFFDDLFAELDREHIQRIFKSLSRVAETAKIYFLVTSPSWLFLARDLQQYRRDFDLIDSLDTPISGLDPEDRESLKKQYLEIYGEKRRPELIKLIEDEKDLILIKIALHQNLHYSEYFVKTFNTLEHEELQRYLAALLLSCTISRFYVHLSLPIIEQINKQFGLNPPNCLPDRASEYERFSVRGFSLFRIRKGTRMEHHLSGLPDTVAPLHDRIAQVIYSTWGDKKVPLLGLKIWELSDKVNQELDRLPETRPILAQVFRGMLRPTQYNEQELEYFVDNFGPVRQGKWVLLDDPFASHRWITYAKYEVERTRNLQQSWNRVLNHTIVRGGIELARVRLLSFLLEPRREAYSANIDWMHHIPELGENCFYIIRDVLDRLIRSQPHQTDILRNYIISIKDWLNNYPKSIESKLSYRYLIMSSIANADVGNLEIQKGLNEAIIGIAKSYMINIVEEQKSNRLLSAKLFTNIRWPASDSNEISEVLLQYLQDNRNWFRPVLFERLLEFIRNGRLSKPSGTELFDLLFHISVQIPKSSSLTYSWQLFFEHLKSLNSIRPHEYRQTLFHMRDQIFSQKSRDFMNTAGYPDFIHRFLDHISHVQHEFKAAEMVFLLRPLVELPIEHSETMWAFIAARGIIWLDLKSFCDQVDNDTDKQIRLCMASSVNLAMEVVLSDFAELLSKDKITIPTTVCFFLKGYFQERQKGTIPADLLDNCMRQIYTWLHDRSNREEEIQRRATPVLLLACSSILFSGARMRGLENLAQKAIEKGHFAPVVPFDYLNWWLKEEVLKTSRQNVSSVLDAYWNYCLENSNFRDKNRRFLIYDRYFLYILGNYDLKRDEIWWGQATKRLIEFYYNSLQSLHSKKSKWVTLKGVKVKRDIYEYERRNCLEKIMNTILDRYESEKNELQGSFRSIVKKVLEQYKDCGWAAYWLNKLEPGIEIDHTQLFLNYLNSIETEHSNLNVFDIRNNSERWVNAIRISKSELLPEVSRIWEWLNKIRTPNISVYLVGLLLKLFPKELQDFPCANLVIQVLKNVPSDFSSKSVLIRRYIEWLEDSRDEISSGHIKSLNIILEWLLQEMAKATDVQSIMYGSQDLFKAAKKFDIDFELVKAKGVFFKALESCGDVEGGAAPSKDYYSWLFHRVSYPDLSDDLEWIQSHWQLPHTQTPYVLMWLIQFLAESTSLNHDLMELEKVWNTLKLLIRKRLDSPGTTGAAQNFAHYLVCLNALPLDLKKRTNEICEELYNLYLEMKTHPRVIYLVANMPAFQRNLRGIVEQPTPKQVLVLWQELFITFSNHRQDDCFTRFTKNVDIYSKGDKEIREMFCQALLSKAKKFPNHWLSPKFVNMILDDTDFIREYTAYVREISELLPEFIKSQREFEDVAYVIKRCLNPRHKRLAFVMPEEEQIGYESRLMESLKMNIHKPYSAVCLFWLVSNCTRQKHYKQLTELISTYLGRANEISDIRINKNLWFNPEKLLWSYHEYIGEVENESQEVLQRNAAQCLLENVGENAKSTGMTRCFSTILKIWSRAYISQDAAVSSLRKLIMAQDVKEWNGVLNSCQCFGELFGYDIPLSLNTSVEAACKQLGSDHEAGLIFLRQTLHS